MIDKYINIVIVLLGEIKERLLDFYVKKEYDMLVRGSIDRNELMSVFKGKGIKIDKLRFVIMYFIFFENIF